MAADLDQFQQLLNTLLSTDNDARTQAEVRITVANHAAMRDGAVLRWATSVIRDAPQHVRAEHVASVCCQSLHVGVRADNAPTTHACCRKAGRRARTRRTTSGASRISMP